LGLVLVLDLDFGLSFDLAISCILIISGLLLGKYPKLV
jgi:hypothetical protein